MGKSKKKFTAVMIIAGVIAVLAVAFVIIVNRFPRMTYIGHASVKIKAKTGEVIYIDPYYPSKSGYSEPADFILMTHDHSDHNVVSLCTQNEGCKVLKCYDVHKHGEYETLEFENIKIEAVPSGGNYNHTILSNVGFIVTVNGVSVYHSGDTSFAEETKCIADHDIDYALYPVHGSFTMGPEEATEMADYIGARVNIPIHGKDGKIKEQCKEFHAKGKRRLIPGQTILLHK